MDVVQCILAFCKEVAETIFEFQTISILEFLCLRSFANENEMGHFNTHFVDR
jgi:hypothetical protein